MVKYLDKNGLRHVISVVADKINEAKNSVLDTKSKPNGLATLDSNGFIPLALLGNVDTIFFEAVTELPTSDIKKRIYLLNNNKDGLNNSYTEYIYNGDVNGEYDESKWEKLGDFVPTFDLKEYAKKSETLSEIDGWSASSTEVTIDIIKGDDTMDSITLPAVSHDYAGVMSASDKNKLDGIEEGATKTVVDIALSTDSTNPVQNKVISEALNKKANTDVVTTTSNGLMSKEDKAKLDSIGNLEQAATGVTFTSSNVVSSINSDGILVKAKNTSQYMSAIAPESIAANLVLTNWVNNAMNLWSITKNYDLVIGNKVPDVYRDSISNASDFDGDGYIKIDSKKSKDSTGNNKNGNMDIVVPNKTGTLCLKRNADSLCSGTILLSSARADDSGNINITQNNDGCVSNVLLTGNNVQLTQSEEYSIEGDDYYTGTNVNLSNTLFSINNKNDSQHEKYFYISHSGDLTDSPNKNEDKIQFFTGTTGDSEIPLLIKKEEIKCWDGQIKTTKGKDIRLKTSSTNSVRLTEGEGFKVFANLYAEPDHATDISSFTDDEKLLLQNNTVLGLLLKIIHYINSKEAGAIQ